MAKESQPRLLEEVMNILKLYSDGSILRSTDHPSCNTPPSEHALPEDGGVVSKDIVLGHNNDEVGHRRWVRLYLPPQRGTPLPILIYFHGGGFCLFTPSYIPFHRFCLGWAAAVGAIIVSVNYRLAPEHRLPAAYEDSIAAAEWVRSQSVKKKAGEADLWLDSHADFSNVYLMGDSAGGNIAHHVGMWAGGKDWEDLRIRGIILLQPFFGAQDRTASEIGCPEVAVLNLETADQLWRLALPMGGNRDHPFCNPFGPESPSLANAALPPMLVVIGGRDLLRDSQSRYCGALKKCGKKVQVVVFEEEEHAFFAINQEGGSSLKVMEYASQFIKSLA